jgi:hypothetical protein
MKSRTYTFLVILTFICACDQQSTNPDSENDVAYQT